MIHADSFDGAPDSRIAATLSGVSVSFPPESASQTSQPDMNPSQDVHALPIRARSGLPSGIADVVAAFRLPRLWLSLGWYDFIIMHRRTAIGPFWQTLQAGVWVGGLGLLFGVLLNRTSQNYIAYLAAGIVIWNFITGSLAGGTGVFVKNRKLILNINNPMFTHVLRDITLSTCRFGFQFLVFIVVLPFSSIEFGLVTLLAIPGLLALLLTAMWVVPLMGIIGARYRDTPYAIGSIMRFLFFTTPVFWVADGLGPRAYIATFNPFTHFLEIVRAPLLGTIPSFLSWSVVVTVNTPSPTSCFNTW